MNWDFDNEFMWILSDAQGATLGYIFNRGGVTDSAGVPLDKTTTAPSFDAALPGGGPEHKGHLNAKVVATCNTLDAAKTALIGLLPINNG
jgi:hypothetical protein